MTKTLQLRFRSVDRDKYDQVVNGMKSIETRAATVKYQDLAVGDNVQLSCGKEKVMKAVVFVKYYDSIEKMLEELPLDKILPGVKDIGAALKIYHGFPGYEEKIRLHGIVAIGLE